MSVINSLRRIKVITVKAITVKESRQLKRKRITFGMNEVMIPLGSEGFICRL